MPSDPSPVEYVNVPKDLYYADDEPKDTMIDKAVDYAV